MLYDLLEASRDIPQFVTKLQILWEKDKLKNEYYFLKDNKTIKTFVVHVDALAEEELARTLISKFRYRDPQPFEEIGIWFPEKIYYCSICRKAIPSFEKRYMDNCKGIEVDRPHLPQKMNELCGILLHENLSHVFPYISEYLVVHALRRLLFTDKLFGFLAHSVLFEDEEIDIIVLIIFKNHVKIFPIEVQISSGVDMKNTEEKFQKLEALIKEIKYPKEYKVQIHNLFITFEEYRKGGGKNFSIHHFSELDELIRNLIYSSI